MARGLIKITNTGLTDIAKYLEKLADQYDPIILQSVKAMQDVVVEKIKINWVSFAGGKPGDYVFDSIGKSTEMSKTDPHVVVGTMGVYHLDSVTASHGRILTATVREDGSVRPGDMNAPQIAYWVEYGTSRLKDGTRKVRGVQYEEEKLAENASPKPFIGNAVYSSIDEQNQAFRMEFTSQVDKIK